MTESLLKVKRRIPRTESNAELVERLQTARSAGVSPASPSTTGPPDSEGEHTSRLLDAKRRRRNG